MFTNKPEFRVKDLIKLAKLSSETLNELLTESGAYLSKRIIAFILAQQINIQIASEKDHFPLRGFTTELEDYTILQLLNFAEIQGIELDTFDVKFRIWTVVLNNQRELSIKDSTIDRILAKKEELYEYPKDIVYNLTRFVDEGNDIDGKPFIIAKESLNRFSTDEEVEAFGNSLGLEIPKRMNRESMVNYILRGLEDSNPDLKAELMSKSMEEIEQYAKDNFVSNDILLSKKEMVNFILDKHTPKDHHISDVEYEKHLDIPSLHGYQGENDEDQRLGPIFDDRLKEMIATIVRGENHRMIEDITEEKSKEELETVMNRIMKTYDAPRRDSEEILLQRIDGLEQKLAERQNYDPQMVALMNKIANMETELVEPEPKETREDLLMNKLAELDRKITMVARGQDPELTEAQQVEKTLLSKIASLEEKLSYQRAPVYGERVPAYPDRTQEYTAKPVQQVAPIIEEIAELVETKKVEEPVFKVAPNDDYEYEIDRPSTKVHPLDFPVKEETKTEEVNDQEAVTEEIAENVATGPSNTELLLIQKIEEIERKLSEKDDEIETLKKDSEKRIQEVAALAAAKALEQVNLMQASQDAEVVEEVIEVPEIEPSLKFVQSEPVEETQEENVELEEVQTQEEQVEVIEESTEEVIESSDDLVEDEVDVTEEDNEESIQDIINDIESMNAEEEVHNLAEDLAEVTEDAESSEFDKFIEEIHSNKDKDKVKVRRRHTVKPIIVFWKTIAIWIMLVSIGAVILFVYNNL